MEKSKSYMLWFCLGVIHYCFVEKLLLTVLNKILIIPVAESDVSRLIFMRNFTFIMVISVSLYLIKHFLEYDTEYYVQPIIFIIGIFFGYVFWNAYLYLSFNDFEFLLVTKKILSPALILVTERLFLVFVIWNGFAIDKKLPHFIFAVIVQALVLFKRNFLNELIRQSTMNNRFPLDSDMVLWIVSLGFFVSFLPYIIFSRRFYETFGYPFE